MQARKRALTETLLILHDDQQAYIERHGTYASLTELSSLLGLGFEYPRQDMQILIDRDQEGWRASVIDFRSRLICRHIGGSTASDADEVTRRGPVCYDRPREEAFRQDAAMLAVERTLSDFGEAQDRFRQEHGRFTSEPLHERGKPWPDIMVEILVADERRLHARMSHPDGPLACEITRTGAAPARTRCWAQPHDFQPLYAHRSN